jgi:hypothetical protein
VDLSRLNLVWREQALASILRQQALMVSLGSSTVVLDLFDLPYTHRPIHASDVPRIRVV